MCLVMNAVKYGLRCTATSFTKKVETVFNYCRIEWLSKRFKLLQLLVVYILWDE